MCLNNLGRNKTDSRNTFSKVFQIHRHQAVFFCPKIPEATNCKPQPELSRKLVGGWPKSHKTLRQPSPRTINKTRCSYRAPVTEYCIPGALPQVYESLGFQPVNGTNVSTALIADAFIQSVPTQQVVNQTNCRNTLQMRPQAETTQFDSITWIYGSSTTTDTILSFNLLHIKTVNILQGRFSQSSATHNQNEF